MAKHPKTVEVKIGSGINNKAPANKTPEGYFKEQVNLDSDPYTNLTKRQGYTLVEAGNFHSLWSDKIGIYAVKDGDLVVVDKCNYSTTVLLSGVGTHPISFERVDDTVYFSSEAVNGKIVDGQIYSWGYPVPSVPSLVELPGSMPKGAYQVALTFLSAQGKESGTSLVAYIEVVANNSIHLPVMPTTSNTEIASIGIYATHPDGQELNLIDIVPIGTTSYTLTDTIRDSQVVYKPNLYPAPLGHLVAWNKGFIFVAQDNILWFSEPMMYDLFDPKEGYLYFDSRITAICPVERGVWISDEHNLYYLQGTSPQDFKKVLKEEVSIVPGTDILIPGDLIAIENTPGGYKWLVTTERGFHVLFNDGLVINVTEKNVNFPRATLGAGALFEEKGISKYISLLQDRKSDGNARVGDEMTATIVRNGITIN